MNIMSRFYCFMLLLLVMSACDASNNPSEELKVQKILNSLNKTPVKSIKGPDGDIIDCVLVSHQTAFDHPLLKNHTIQMRPSVYPEGLFGEGKDDITKPITQLWHQNGSCPKGTVPIRRTEKEDLMRASSVDNFGKKRHNSFSDLPSADDPLDASAFHEYAYATVERNAYYGAKATINVWNPQIQNSKEFSLSQFWIVGGPSSSINTIEAGWQVFPYMFGGYKPRLFVYWTGDGYQNTGCYNLLCSGFVQTSNKMALGGSINPFSTYQGSQIEITILVWKIQWGGEVTDFKLAGRHTATQMGSGHFAQEGYKRASYFRNLQVVDNSNTLRSPDAIRVIARQPNCYNIIPGNSSDWGDYFFYGGPGRNPNCQ